MKKIVILCFCLIILLTIEIKALCVTSVIKTKQLKGIATDSRRNPFSKVRIDLKSPEDFDFIIKSVVTDTEGKFDFGDAKSGKYVVYASNEYVPSFSFEVKHKRTKKIKANEPELKIIVGMTFSGGCEGWSANYGKQST